MSGKVDGAVIRRRRITHSGTTYRNILWIN